MSNTTLIHTSQSDLPKKSADGYTKEKVKAICETKGLASPEVFDLAGMNAANVYLQNNRSRSMSCCNFGAMISYDQGTSGGFWGEFVEADKKHRAKDKAFQAVMKFCAAQYG